MKIRLTNRNRKWWNQKQRNIKFILISWFLNFNGRKMWDWRRRNVVDQLTVDEVTWQQVSNATGVKSSTQVKMGEQVALWVACTCLWRLRSACSPPTWLCSKTDLSSVQTWAVGQLRDEENSIQISLFLLFFSEVKFLFLFQSQLEAVNKHGHMMILLMFIGGETGMSCDCVNRIMWKLTFWNSFCNNELIGLFVDGPALTLVGLKTEPNWSIIFSSQRIFVLNWRQQTDSQRGSCFLQTTNNLPWRFLPAEEAETSTRLKCQNPPFVGQFFFF